MENNSGTTLLPNGGYPMHSFEDLKDVFYSYITNQDDRNLIEKAYLFAKQQHEGQFRKSGEPYIVHPLEVAYIVASLQAGPSTICSAFLHDVVEDTETTVEEIKEMFNEDVSKIVDSLTKIQRLKLSHRTEAEFEAEDHKKIFLGMAKDVRVIIVKLADRLHNLRTIKALSDIRQHVIAQETLDVFTPIAHRLGIYTVQSELEDLCLKVLEPEKFDNITTLVQERCEHGENSLKSLTKRIADLLFEKNIPFKIESRVKSIYSIYRKMYQKGHDFDDIYDVLAIRIITESVQNCYEILGYVHATYKPLPGRFKDYIAMPKPNMYQSLHTSIISGDGQTYEIQIRTEEMDRIAETGIAAHWKYKEGSNYNAKAEQKEIEEKLHWFRDFVSMSGENKTSATATEFVDNINKDIFGANVYVFTPQGRVIELPDGATPLDFAYRIHTKVGDSAVGAIVNGVGVTLGTVLKTGDICEIRTSKNSPGPNVGWLSIVKTASAKANIRKALQKKDAEAMRETNIKDGRASATEAFRQQDISEEEMIKYLDQPKVFQEYGVNSLDDLFVAISNKNPSPTSIIEFLNLKKKVSLSESELLKRLGKTATAQSNNPVLVNGADGNIAITLGNCCKPIPGDTIVGYITRGKGITVHRHDCPNIAKETKRLIDVNWNPAIKDGNYSVAVEIYATDRPNLVAEILNVLAARGVGCNDLHAHSIESNNNAVIAMNLLVSSGKILEDVKAQLQGLKGVHSIERVTR